MDRLSEMEAFVQVVDCGGFTEAARKLGVSKSAVSKSVSSLESRLGVRLLTRTTRRVSPTDLGLAYYDRSLTVLKDATDADEMVTSMQASPRGSLRISVPVSFGVKHLSRAVAGFLCEYPEVSVNMVLDDRFVELVAEGYDLAIQIGVLKDSTARPQARHRAAAAGGLGELHRPERPAGLDRRSRRPHAPALFQPRHRQFLAPARRLPARSGRSVSAGGSRPTTARR